jgi:Putative transposase
MSKNCPMSSGSNENLLVGRYTHRVAISNNRLLDIDDGTVTFRWKDYRDDKRPKDHDPRGR